MNRLFLLLGIISLLTFISCHSHKKDNPNYIKVGIETGPEYTVAETAKKVAREKYGLEVELVKFNDYIIPNTALNDGDIDANAIQHKPFLDNLVKQRNYKLTTVANTFIYPLAGYSKKIKSIADLADGNTIAIPNDPTNGGRALLLLQKYKLIQLKDDNNLIPKVTDIIKNPKNLHILELEAPQLPKVLDDNQVSIAIINNTFAAKAGLSLQNAIFVEDKDSPYVNVIATREDNKNAENVKKFIRAYQSEEVVQTAAREFKGGAIKGW